MLTHSHSQVRGLSEAKVPWLLQKIFKLTDLAIIKNPSSDTHGSGGWLLQKIKLTSGYLILIDLFSINNIEH